MSPDTPYNDEEVERIMAEHNLNLSWQEKVFASPQLRRVVIAYSFFLFLLIYNPFG